jgi:Mannosyltransferase (PIG-V)
VISRARWNLRGRLRWSPRWKPGEERTRNLKTTAIAFAANKSLVILVSAIASRHTWSSRSFFGAIHYVLVDNFRYFDAGHYVGIATQGYADLKSTTFFPGYPLLIKAVSWGLHISALAAGVLISNVAFFLLLYFFLKLALVDYDWVHSRRSLLLLALFPTAFYFSAAYTEATFMLISVLALLGMRKERWTRAGLYGGIASALRNTGVLLGLPYLIEYWTAQREKKRERISPPESPSTSQQVSPHAGWGPVAWVLLIGAGALAYLVYLWLAKGDPLAFARGQKAYGRGTGTPWGTLYHGYVYGLKVLVHLHRPLNWTQVYYVSQLFFPTLVIVVLVASFRKIRWSYWAIIFYSLIVPLLAPANAAPGLGSSVIDYFVSFSRYTLVIVPLFFGIERLLKRRWAYWVYLVFSALFLVLLTYAWSRHKWVA